MLFTDGIVIIISKGIKKTTILTTYLKLMKTAIVNLKERMLYLKIRVMLVISRIVIPMLSATTS